MLLFFLKFLTKIKAPSSRELLFCLLVDCYFIFSFFNLKIHSLWFFYFVPILFITLLTLIVAIFVILRAL